MKTGVALFKICLLIDADFVTLLEIESGAAEDDLLGGAVDEADLHGDDQLNRGGAAGALVGDDGEGNVADDGAVKHGVGL